MEAKAAVVEVDRAGAMMGWTRHQGIHMALRSLSHVVNTHSTTIRLIATKIAEGAFGGKDFWTSPSRSRWTALSRETGRRRSN